MVAFVYFTFVSSWQKPTVSICVNQCLTLVFVPSCLRGKNLLKTAQKVTHLCKKVLKVANFCQKRCKKVLIFTLIFTLKTNMSYNLYPLYIANQPIFKISLKNPNFFNFFYLSITLFNSAFLHIYSFTFIFPCA